MRLTLLFIFAIMGSNLLAQQNQPVSSLPKEDVYVHAGQSIAVAGERLPLSINITMDQAPTKSTFAYADLVSRSGKRFGGAVIPLKNGKASAYLTVPENTPSDHYLLRVYSRYAASLNDASQYHQELISVINPAIPPAPKAAEKPLDGNWQSITASNAITVQPEKEALNLGEQSSLRLSASPDSKVTVSISRKNPFLDRTQWVQNSPPSKTKPQMEALLPELRGHIIKGTLTAKEADTTKLYFLSAHGDQSALYLGKANRKGEIYFDLGALKHYEFLLLQSDVDSVPFGLNLQLPFADAPAEGLDFPPLEITPAQKELLDNLVLSASTSTYFLKPRQQNLQPIVTGYAPDRGYNLDDYNRFEDLATTLKEYMPTALVRKNKGKYYFKLTNIPEHSVFDGNPLILVDGMPVFDSDKLAQFSPENIKRAEIINRRFYILSYGFDGILSFTSYDNDFGGYPIPEHALYLEYPPIQQPVSWQFNAPKKDEHFPDFRSVLLWEESVQLDDSGKASLSFTASQVPGTYEIRVSQITPDGRQVWTTKELEVIDEK
ncbi:hypothetical protein Echvi_3947 [Echinicola vietnamensis DSM 17526]|uniref:Large extracellular alpha-helical protein n=2 Tax=Echinicola TaxID=390846 RepID=L0G3Q9_ECHVK|nr:hypothetical protein Echvi_3947 [Echinicola vietnamensis DSM 17526]